MEYDVMETSPDSAKAGIRDIFPMLLGTAPFGLIFGSLVSETGLGVIGGQSFSIFVFGGASQFVAANLYGNGATIVVILIATFFINLRHALYGASLAPKLETRKLKERFLMSFFLTDEAFAVVSRFKLVKSRYFWGAAGAMYCNWQIWTFLGILISSQIEFNASLNIGFFMVPAFLAIVVPQMNKLISINCGIVSLVLSLFMTEFPYQSGFIISALLGIVIALIFDCFTSKITPTKGT